MPVVLSAPDGIPGTASAGIPGTASAACVRQEGSSHIIARAAAVIIAIPLLPVFIQPLLFYSRRSKYTGLPNSYFYSIISETKWKNARQKILFFYDSLLLFAPWPVTLPFL